MPASYIIYSRDFYAIQTNETNLILKMFCKIHKGQANDNLHERTSPRYLTCLQDPKHDTKMSEPGLDPQTLMPNDTVHRGVGCML